MKLEDHTALLQKIRTSLSSDTLDIAGITADLTTLSTDYTEVTATSEKLTTDFAKVTEENKTLLKQNMDLFLKVGVTPPEPPKPDLPKPDEQKPLSFEDLFNEKGELK